MIFIFIDGFGIGEKDPKKNPYYVADTSNFEYLAERFGVYVTDATLGVPGLPQSATGQTAIYTGVNAPKAIGKHWSTRPTQELREIIFQDNLFMSMKRAEKRVTFANAYSKEYLNQMEKSPKGIYKPSVTTLQCLSSNTPFRTIDDYLNGYGVCHDILGRRLLELGYDIPLITPQKAAENLYRISRDYDLTLFEFFMTDIMGHTMDMEKAVHELEILNGLLGRLIELMDFSEDALLITSDHGNIEDLSVRTHTMNPVPTIIASDAYDKDSISIKDLTDIKPMILKMYHI